jgi:hypothetical protein
LRCTQHVLFLDTPHKGFEEYICTYGAEVRSPSVALSQQLGRGSTVLLDLERKFAEVLLNITFTSCFATEAEIFGDREKKVSGIHAVPNSILVNDG